MFEYPFSPHNWLYFVCSSIGHKLCRTCFCCCKCVTFSHTGTGCWSKCPKWLSKPCPISLELAQNVAYEFTIRRTHNVLIIIPVKCSILFCSTQMPKTTPVICFIIISAEKWTQDISSPYVRKMVVSMRQFRASLTWDSFIEFAAVHLWVWNLTFNTRLWFDHDTNKFADAFWNEPIFLYQRKHLMNQTAISLIQFILM